MLDKSHIAHLCVRYKNIEHLFSLKHSKTSMLSLPAGDKGRY